MSEVVVIDNFLPTEVFSEIQSHIVSSSQPWCYQRNITSVKKKGVGLGHHGFNFWVVNPNKPNNLTEHESSQLLSPLLGKMKGLTGCKNILRSRLDMTLYAGRSKKGEPHVDSEKSHIVTIFYLIDSDGDTVVYNQVYNPQKDQRLTVKKRIQPKENRVVMFDGKYIHTGHTPSRHNRRILINTDFD